MIKFTDTENGFLTNCDEREGAIYNLAKIQNFCEIITSQNGLHLITPSSVKLAYEIFYQEILRLKNLIENS